MPIINIRGRNKEINFDDFITSKFISIEDAYLLGLTRLSANDNYKSFGYREFIEVHEISPLFVIFVGLVDLGIAAKYQFDNQFYMGIIRKAYHYLNESRACNKCISFRKQKAFNLINHQFFDHKINPYQILKELNIK